MRVPDAFLKCVGFISIDRSPGDSPYIGTMFVVGIKTKSGGVLLHAVTARHVAESVGGRPFLFGINFKDGRAGWLRSELPWWYHPTEPMTDVAVTIFAPTERCDVEYILEATFVDDESIKEFNIGPGDELSVVGLFTNFYGSTKHIPIVRTGNVAMMPSDSLPTDSGPTEVYLAEGRSIGGLSGSPVFVRPTTRIMGLGDESGRPRPVFGAGGFQFFGLMRGHWDLPIGTPPVTAEAVNMGISIVVPAKKILETLYHPELVALREKRDQELGAMGNQPG